MTPRQQRMTFVAIILSGVILATVLVLNAIGENMLYFFSPSQIEAGENPDNAKIRVGGLVVNGSVKRAEDESLNVQFDLTDGLAQLTVQYDGILPDLFREGQGIVAHGRIDAAGILVADEVLAKHDENYMPPEVAAALEEAAKSGKPMVMPQDHQYKKTY